MIDYAMLERLQREAEQEYLSAVEATEAELGLRLPRFRETQFVFTQLGQGKGPGSNPFYRRFAVPDQPLWDASAYAPEGRAALARFEDESAVLCEELRSAGRADEYRAADTGYHGIDEAWQSLDVVTEEGRPLDDVLTRFPRMADILSELTAADYACRTFFAKMRPGAHLRPHCGGQNIYLRLHVPLVIPAGNCGIRISGTVHRWRPGTNLLFDDTYEHEAWNRTKHDRTLLLMRMLHPDLSREERAAFFDIERRFTGTAIHRTLENLKKFVPRFAA